jgi:hypothetical protein
VAVLDLVALVQTLELLVGLVGLVVVRVAQTQLLD